MFHIKTGSDLDEFIERCYGATRDPGETDNQFRARVLANVYGVCSGHVGQTVSPPTLTPATVSQSGSTITLHFNGPLTAFAPADPVLVTAGIYKGCKGQIRQDTGQPSEWFVDLPGIGIVRLLEIEMVPDPAVSTKPDHEQPSTPAAPVAPPSPCAFCQLASKRAYPYGTRSASWRICESTRCWSAALIAKEWLETGGIQESEELLRDAVRRAVSREPKRY